jgi:D-glycero-D-manno-heptose 1,7-bisphosphate phosphatase
VGSLSRRAVFLDRDGTLNERPPEHEYVSSEHDFAWLPGAREALARLARTGFVLAVASNQRGVARGLVTVAALHAVERKIQADLEPHGCRIEAFGYCLHDLDAGCACRKPRPGMLHDLAASLDLDLASSWMVGDAGSDVEAGRAAGCRTALVGAANARGAAADLVAPTLDETSRLIVASVGRA